MPYPRELKSDSIKKLEIFLSDFPTQINYSRRVINIATDQSGVYFFASFHISLQLTEPPKPYAPQPPDPEKGIRFAAGSNRVEHCFFVESSLSGT